MENVIVINKKTERYTGKKARAINITAAREVAEIVRTSLGPRAMLKMLLDPMGGIVMTNDGNAILREIDVSQPAAKCLIELSRTQEEEVGDGTTSVIILCGEILGGSLSLLERNIHPTIIVKAFKKILELLVESIINESKPVNNLDDEEMLKLIKNCIGTKLASEFEDIIAEIALKATRCVSSDELDIKRYVRIEKIPGGQLKDSGFLDGIIINKDITHPAMRRRIENPRIVLIDCPLEYKKGESATNIEIQKEGDWSRYLELEEQQVIQACERIALLKPDIVISEKGISDLAQHIFVKHNITALRRVKKSDNNRISRAVGATIINRADDLEEKHVGTGCGLFKIEKIGDEYFSYLVECRSPRACSVVLRGPSKDVLNELGRNLDDAMCVSRCLLQSPMLSPGGGATEMAASSFVLKQSNTVGGVEQYCYDCISNAMEIIPRTLIQNSGGDPIKTLTMLRVQHSSSEGTWGINGETGDLMDMKQEKGIWEPTIVKIQTLRTAVEAACMILRVDDVLAGMSSKEREKSVHEQIEENEMTAE